MTLDARHIHFLGYRLDPVARTLAAPDGNDIALNGRAFDVLSYLIEHRPRVIGKDELLSAAWPGRVVEENNLCSTFCPRANFVICLRHGKSGLWVYLNRITLKFVGFFNYPLHLIFITTPSAK